MQIFGLTITRTKSLSPVDGSRSWWPMIREMTTGAWQRNEEVRVDSALSNPTLFACVTLIAGDIAKLRPMLVERDANFIWTEVESPAFSPVLRKPNHYQTWIEFIEWWMVSKLLHGNTYVLKARDERGVVKQMYVLDPLHVRAMVAPDRSVFYELQPDELGASEPSVLVPAREVIHDKACPGFHALVGLSPLYAAGYPAIEGLTIRKASERFFANGSRPSAVLQVPGAIAQETADKIKVYWDSAFSGDNTGKIAVLTEGMTYQPVAMLTADQSKLVEQLNMTDEDIAKAFHMPRHKVGIGPDPTYNNIESLNKQYYSDCLQQHIVKLEYALDNGMGLGNVPGKILGIEFDRDALFEMDTQAKSEAAQKAIQSGVTPNEVRSRFWALGPVPGGDQPFLQEQQWPIRLLAERALPTRPPTAPETMGIDADEAKAAIFDKATRLLRAS